LKQLPRPIPMPARSFPTQSYRNSVSSEVCNRTFARTHRHPRCFDRVVSLGSVAIEAEANERGDRVCPSC
jgi:hypothetical protein